jgi:hypothetical protein
MGELGECRLEWRQGQEQADDEQSKCVIFRMGTVLVAGEREPIR